MKKTTYMIFTPFVVVLILFTCSTSYARSEPTQLVQIYDLHPESEYDWKEVVIEGWVRKIEVIKGIRDSRYLHMIVGLDKHNIDVFLAPATILGDILGQRVIIRATYKPWGRFGGFLQSDDFLVASVIVRDWDYER